MAVHYCYQETYHDVNYGISRQARYVVGQPAFDEAPLFNGEG